jgi:2-polyprenyl-6-methoxyphenol hydroxylase-like FAD-dependent oxidoreductase
LLDALASEPNVNVHVGEGATDWRARTVTAGSRELRADLVVAADGVHSLLRNAIAPDAKVTKGPIYVRAIVPSKSGADATTARFARRWAAVLPHAGALFEGATDLLVNDCDVVHAPTCVNGNAVLLGDAAHAMLPNAGQGANSAFVDGAVLVDQLARRDIPGALAAYATRRQPAVARVQKDAARLARLAHMQNPIVRAARSCSGWPPSSPRRSARPGSTRKTRPVSTRLRVARTRIDGGRLGRFSFAA